MPPADKAPPQSAPTPGGPAPSASKKRSMAPKRGAIACQRCKERKSKCVPAPPGSSPVPTCTNCLGAKKECIYLERTPNEIFLLEYVSQLESRCASLEIELRRLNPSSQFTVDHDHHVHAPAEALSAAVDKLNAVYPAGPPGSFSAAAAAGQGGHGQAHAQHVRPGWQTESSKEAEYVKTFLSNSGESAEGGQGAQGAQAGQAGQAGQGGQRGEGKGEDEGEDEDDFALGMGMLSLGGGEEPVYVGPSSGVNWARVCAAALRRPRDRSQPSHLSRFSYLAPPELASAQSALEYTLHHPTPPLPSPALAAHYLDLVYEHVQARYGCFDWQAVRYWHENRQVICQGRPLWGVGTGEDERRSLGAFFMWLCYGYGARLDEGEKKFGHVGHEVYYNAAVACLSTLTSHHSLATVQALVLLTIYGFRHPTAEVSVWQVGGLSMRTAVELGLHRRTRSRAEREKDPRRYEMKKRVFWAVYSLDRMMSAQLGRPSGIQDRDIDVELPLNVDVNFNDAKALAAMQNKQLEMMGGRRPGDEYEQGYGEVTSMTSAIHNIRLNQLKQLVQDATYRLDKPLRPRPRDVQSPERQSIPEVDSLLVRLDQWRACHPDPPPGTRVPMLPREHWELEYQNCVQMLLRPIVAHRKADRRYVALCLESAAALCETQYAYVQPPVASFKLSTWRFYRIFLAGMTLLHIMSTFSHSPSSTAPPILSEQDLARAESGIRHCEGALSVWGERFRGAKRHEKLFRELVDAWEARRAGGAAEAGGTGGPGGDVAMRHSSPSASHPPTTFPASTSGPSVLLTHAPNHAHPNLGDTTLQPDSADDLMSHFLHMVEASYAQATPTRQEQIHGQEIPSPLQALFSADTSCAGGELISAQAGAVFPGAGIRGWPGAGFGRSAGLQSPQQEQHQWQGLQGGVGVDIGSDEWSSGLGMGSSGSGRADDFFSSLITSLGIDTDTQTPLLNLDLSEPIFDYSATQLTAGLGNPGDSDGPGGSAWGMSPPENSHQGSGGNPSHPGAYTLGGLGGMGEMVDPNMGMGDWVEGLGYRQNTEPSSQPTSGGNAPTGGNSVPNARQGPSGGASGGTASGARDAGQVNGGDGKPRSGDIMGWGMSMGGFSGSV